MQKPLIFKQNLKKVQIWPILRCCQALKLCGIDSAGAKTPALAEFQSPKASLRSPRHLRFGSRVSRSRPWRFPKFRASQLGKRRPDKVVVFCQLRWSDDGLNFGSRYRFSHPLHRSRTVLAPENIAKVANWDSPLRILKNIVF